MFCPQCGTTQSDDLKFCKSCGANLSAVRQAVATRNPDEKKRDWRKTWVAELERQRDIAPETKRYNEIKAGVITSAVGIATMVFLAIFMEGIIRSGKASTEAVEILSRLWIAGIFPFLVGVGLLINGTFVSKRQLEARNAATGNPLPKSRVDPQQLGSSDSTEFIPPGFSVTESTTKHLSTSAKD